ncbi:hypothetical protein [Paragemmobacter kunshanensis]|uniref:hypothetical protein n=1 Tax=Paragemmobacter kunshanensis TaxID=2583234 RepID=UPI0019CF9EA1|nr:hypothetical protein [Rhodobacter kunshanensis]
MIAFFKLALFGYIGLTVIYWILSIYSRSLERERLEKDYDQGDIPGPRDAHVERGMAEYERSLRRRLIWLVFVIPTAVVIALVWILNFS